MRKILRFAAYSVMASYLAAVYFVSLDIHSNATIFIDDGLEYSKSVERGEAPANPHHLLYHPLVLAAHKIMHAISPEMFPRAVRSLQLFSSVMGALGVIFFYAALRLLIGNGFIALMASIALAFCRGYWYYAASAETIAPGAAMGIISFYFLVTAVERPSGFRCVFLGLVNALAVLMRQDNGLLVIPFSYLIAVSMSEEKGKRLFQYWSSFVLVVAAVYSAMFMSRIAPRLSLSGLYSWCTLYNQHPGWGDWGNVEIRAFHAGIVRFCRTLGLGGLEGVPLISYGAIAPVIQRMSQLVSVLLAGLLALILGFGIVRRDSIKRSDGNIIITLILWIITRELFYLWWLPERALAWSVGSMAPFWALIGLVLWGLFSAGDAFPVYCASSALLFAVGVSGALTMQYGSRHDYYARMSFYDSFSRPGDLIFVRDFHDDPLLTYFGGRRVQLIDYYDHFEERSLMPQRDKGEIESTLKSARCVYVIPFAAGEVRDDCFNPRYAGLEKGLFSAYNMTPCHVRTGGKDMVAAWRLSP